MRVDRFNKCDTTVLNHFHSQTYDQFYLERVASQKGFIRSEIEWALYEINYKYFGSYEMTDQQCMAVDILEWVAKQYLK